MAEVLEYTLVVLVSLVLAAASVTTYGSFTGFVSGVSLKAEFSSVSALAEEAAGNGSARGVVPTAASVISCEGGVLTVSVGSGSQSGGIGAPCSFAVDVSAGTHTVVFSRQTAGLALSVT